MDVLCYDFMCGAESAIKYYFLNVLEHNIKYCADKNVIQLNYAIVHFYARYFDTCYRNFSIVGCENWGGKKPARTYTKQYELGIIQHRTILILIKIKMLILFFAQFNSAHLYLFYNTVNNRTRARYAYYNIMWRIIYFIVTVRTIIILLQFKYKSYVFHLICFVKKKKQIWTFFS